MDPLDVRGWVLRKIGASCSSHGRNAHGASSEADGPLSQRFIPVLAEDERARRNVCEDASVPAVGAGGNRRRRIAGGAYGEGDLNEEVGSTLVEELRRRFAFGGD